LNTFTNLNFDRATYKKTSIRGTGARKRTPSKVWSRNRPRSEDVRDRPPGPGSRPRATSLTHLLERVGQCALRRAEDAADPLLEHTWRDWPRGFARLATHAAPLVHTWSDWPREFARLALHAALLVPTWSGLAAGIRPPAPERPDPRSAAPRMTTRTPPSSDGRREPPPREFARARRAADTDTDIQEPRLPASALIAARPQRLRVPAA
jgi:hypothetical protein